MSFPKICFGTNLTFVGKTKLILYLYLILKLHELGRNACFDFAAILNLISWCIAMTSHDHIMSSLIVLAPNLIIMFWILLSNSSFLYNFHFFFFLYIKRYLNTMKKCLILSNLLLFFVTLFVHWFCRFLSLFFGGFSVDQSIN